MSPSRPCRRLNLALALPSALIAALLALAPVPVAAADSAPATKRLELPGPAGQPLPYSVEVPADWRVYRVEGSSDFWLGPVGATPGKDPRMIFVRFSPASLAEPEKVVANIRASDAADGKWAAPEVAVKEMGGVRGVLVRMDAGEGAEAHSTLALKLPIAQTSLDLMASAGRAEFDALRPAYERILFSVRPVAGK